MFIGIIFSLGLLIYIAYKGLPVILFAPFCALLAAATSGFDPYPTYTELYMIKAVSYVKTTFPIFLFAAVFGKVMEESGSARAISNLIVDKLGLKRAPVAVIFATAILIFGGVKPTIVAFAIYPFALAMFEKGEFPRRLIPACIAVGAYGLTMTCLPGTPTIQNMIPTMYLNTTLYAAPVFGLVGGAVMLIISIVWINYRIRTVKAIEGFGEVDTRVTKDMGDMQLPNAWLVLTPLVAMFIINYVCTDIFLSWNPEILKIPALKNHSMLAKTIPATTWALVTSLIISTLMIIVFCRKQFIQRRNLSATLTAGAIGSLLGVMNIASEVGFGNVIAVLPGFTVVRDFVVAASPSGSPLFAVMMVTNAMAGITGSASGGLAIAMDTMGETFKQMAQTKDISPDLIHRVATMASGGLDSLPHNGSIITLLAICGLTHKQSYGDIGMVTVVIPMATTVVMVIIWSLFGFTM